MHKKKSLAALPRPAVPLPEARGYGIHPSGPHLYPAQQDSARWGHRAGRSSLLLVGLTDSRGSHTFGHNRPLDALPYLPSPFVSLL